MCRLPALQARRGAPVLPRASDPRCAICYRPRRHDLRARLQGAAEGRVCGWPPPGRSRRRQHVARNSSSCRDRLDRRNVDMIVLSREVLSGFAEHGTARTALGVEASRCVRLLGELACSVVAWSPAGRRSPSARARAAERNCPAFWAAGRASFRLGDAGEQPLDLGQQLRVLLNQRREECRRVVVVRRIGRPLSHAALESARPSPLNTSRLSHTGRVSSYN